MVRNSSTRCKACFAQRSRRLLRRYALLVFALASPLVTAGSQRALQRADKRVVVDLGHNLGGAASLRILKHLEPWTYQPSAGETHEQLVQQLLAAVAANDTTALPQVDGRPLFLVTLGDTAAAAALIEADQLAGVGNEGFVVHSQHRNGFTVLAANGNAMSEAAARSTLSQQPAGGTHTASIRGDDSPHRHLVNTGAVTAAYAALEELGFAFFHPLQPISPVLLRQPDDLHREESPRWHYRGFHIHTQHPLELTDVLQGFDVISNASASTAKQQSVSEAAAAAAAAAKSSGGRFRYLKSLWSGSSSSSSSSKTAITEAVNADAPLSEQLTEPYAGMHSDHHHRSAATDDDSSTTAPDAAAAAGSGSTASTTANTTTAAGTDNSGIESWESMLSDVEAFFEWCAANRVNRVEWMLLGDEKWDSVAHSPLRQTRLARLVSIAHNYGVLAGADVPIGLQQQHAWYMVKPKQSRHEQIRAIQERCDWVAAAGFDFISTESGLSEFTHPGDELMLSLMDTFANHVVSAMHTLLTDYLSIFILSCKPCECEWMHLGMVTTHCCVKYIWYMLLLQLAVSSSCSKAFCLHSTASKQVTKYSC
jgi:hypothetical protein